MTDPIPSAPAALPLPSHRDRPELWEAARQLEAGFLSEMLKAAGLGRPPELFGGGPGEEQFASFLRDQQADAMVRAGGIGLAESLYQSLLERER